MANPRLESLMNKEVSRKEFLALILLAVGSILGMGQIIKLLTGKSLGGHRVIQNSDDYSSSVYGGKH
jgi:hypothetical protein